MCQSSVQLGGAAPLVVPFVPPRLSASAASTTPWPASASQPPAAQPVAFRRELLPELTVQRRLRKRYYVHGQSIRNIVQQQHLQL